MAPLIAPNHLSLALLSLVLVVLVAWQGLTLGVRVTASGTSPLRLIWLTLGPLLTGVGLWAVDFVSLLAWLRQPMSYFNPVYSLASYFACVGILFAILWVGTSPRICWPRLVIAAPVAILLGLLLHYLNLRSANVNAFDGRGLGAMVVTGVCVTLIIVGAVAVMRASRHPRRERWFVRRACRALGVGLGAWLGLHVALAFAIVPLHLPAVPDPGGSVLWLGGMAGTGALLLMLTVSLLSHHSTRLYVRAQRMSGSISQLNTEITHLATHDALTSLPNRQTLVSAIAKALTEARERQGEAAVLYIDLDGFKAINDTYGHAFGDQVLCTVAQRLRSHLSPGDLARVGGDEFVAVLRQGRSAPHARALAMRLIQAMQAPLPIAGIDVQLTTSIGIASYPQDGEDIEELIANADLAMYEAKAQGRNQWRSHDAGLKSRALRLLQIQHGLRSSIEDGSLSLHYQPKHDCRTGVILGAEALVRWQHPELGVVSPAEFIPIAERSGQIVALGEWVIAQACRQLQHWRRRGMPTPRVAINLSPLQLAQPELVERAAALVEAAGLDPGQIMFEVTETMAMQDAERTTAVLGAFRARGFEFAIDDFGTGYSSLAYLQKFQVRQLKIDRFFINALDGGGPQARAIVGAIIALAHTLGLEVVAEGVETASQAAELKAFGCDQIQGYLLSRPMPAADFERACLTSDSIRTPPMADAC